MTRWGLTSLSALCMCARCSFKALFNGSLTGGGLTASVVSLGPQFCGYIGRMAFSVRALVVQHLIEAKLLPAHYVPRDQLDIPMQLHRIAQPLLGREAEVQQVMGSLLEHHAAVIWGGPGEGKSSIAMEAGCRLWDAEKCLGGCFSIDCLGAPRTHHALVEAVPKAPLLPFLTYRRGYGERERVCGCTACPHVGIMHGMHLPVLLLLGGK